MASNIATAFCRSLTSTARVASSHVLQMNRAMLSRVNLVRCTPTRGASKSSRRNGRLFSRFAIQKPPSSFLIKNLNLTAGSYVRLFGDVSNRERQSSPGRALPRCSDCTNFDGQSMSVAVRPCSLRVRRTRLTKNFLSMSDATILLITSWRMVKCYLRPHSWLRHQLQNGNPWKSWWTHNVKGQKD